MAEAVNQQIADRLTERQLLAGRVESSLRREAWEQLRLLEEEILSTLKAHDPTEFVLLSRRRHEVEMLMREEIDPLIVARYERLARLMDDAMGELAQQEAGAVQRIVNDVTDEETIEETPTDAGLKRRVAGALFPTPTRPTDLSTTGADWWQRQGESLSQRMGDSLLVGVSLEESLTQLTQRLRGTSEAAFKDGLMGKARDDAARLLTTQTTNAVGEARVTVAERNAQGLMLVHSSVLDSRTCLEGQTLVRTPTGSRAIEAIRPGDIVFGGSGQPRLVLATHRRPTQQLVRITFSDGTTILCTPDHHFLTKDFGWVEAQKLQQNTVLRTETML